MPLEVSSATAGPPAVARGHHNWRLLFLMLVIGGLLGGSAVYLQLRSFPAASRAVALERQLYQCPMHPTVTADHPGDCPICGMKLVEVKTGPAAAAAAVNDSPGLATVAIDAARQQLIGLRTAAVTSGDVGGSWRTVGRVQIDPTRVRRTNVKVEGYVERLYVDFVGRSVRRGEPLFSLYSPSLLAAEGEYLLALETRERLAEVGADSSDGQALVAAARRKLELWDVPAAELERLDRTRQPSRVMTFMSPISGVVTAKSIVEGARLNPGDTPLEITDLSVVWIMADAYAADLAQVRVGLPATFSLTGDPGHAFAGSVAFIDPLMDPQTRTAKVHLHFGNDGGALRPEMYGEVTLQGVTRTGLQVPADAVVRSGTTDVVFLALGDGRFAPRQVHLGEQRDDLVEVVSGLEVGQQVVTRANFLVDSESQLRASLAAIGGN